MRRLLLLGCVAAVLSPSSAEASPASRHDALRQWVTITEALQVPTGWTGSTEDCTRGSESAESRQATLTAINALRDFAGLAPVTLDPVKNDKALAAALMMDAAGDLSHTPGEDWPCSTADGREAALRSNLSLGATGAGAMVGYVEDSGVDSLGHRRWVLDPAATTFGTGSTTRANALWTIGDGSPQASAGPPLIAWPPEGWVPWNLVFGTWSVGMNTEGVDVSAAQVTVTVDGRPRTVSNVRTLEPGYGAADPTLAWEVALEPSERTADQDVAVAIDGVTVNGAPVPIRYTIQAFAVAPPEIRMIGYRRPRTLRPGRKVRIVAEVSNAVSTTYQWLRNGQPIAGAMRRSYRLRKADRGTRIRGRVTATGTTTVTRLGPKLKVKRR